jgi:hypothetical protein
LSAELLLIVLLSTVPLPSGFVSGVLLLLILMSLILLPIASRRALLLFLPQLNLLLPVKLLLASPFAAYLFKLSLNLFKTLTFQLQFKL